MCLISFSHNLCEFMLLLINSNSMELQIKKDLRVYGIYLNYLKYRVYFEIITISGELCNLPRSLMNLSHLVQRDH